MSAQPQPSGTSGTVHDFLLPDLGEGLTEAEIVSWLVAVGDDVAIDQPLAELESAKSVVDMPSPWAGTVTALHFAVGDTVHAGQALVSIAETSSPSTSSDPEATAGSSASAPMSGEESGTIPSTTPEPEAENGDAGSGAVLIGYGTSESVVTITRGRGRFGKGGAREPAATTAPTLPGRHTRQAPDDLPMPGTPASTHISPVISPLVRRLALEHGIVAKHLVGSGPSGLVTRADVEAAIAARGSADVPATTRAPATRPAADRADVEHPAAASAGEPDLRIPVTGLRKVVADRLSRSRREVPEATIWMDVDATGLLAAKKALQERTGEKYSLLSLVGRFVTAGLRKYPILNSSYDAEHEEIVQHSDIHLGLAAQTPRGLMVPVVHDAGDMRTKELRDAIAGLVERAGTGRFEPHELSGGTFTLNNYGAFGVDGSTPIINLPEAAMLGMGRIMERPWVVDGALTVRSVMYLSFVFDHRVCDGEEPSAFLTFVASCIEDPLAFLAEV